MSGWAFTGLRITAPNSFDALLLQAPLLVTGVIATLVSALAPLRYPPAAGFVFLMWCLAQILRARTLDLFAALFLWFAYSFSYSALGVGREDSEVLLALTTAVHAFAIAFARRLPQTDWVMGPFSLVVILPVQCNNIIYTPLFSVLRALVAVGLQFADRDPPWVLRLYPLFCKQEALPILFAVHIATLYWQRQLPKQLLPTIHKR
jgi:hypothetical protein